ncbi:hypothetical protein GCM10011339_16070 [Echinicola rosea]|uniref:DUF4783 domain-containing protein n=2 Tax=Echinicola rosea TaxID=1807691 RepID=A0ABQ1UX05_9BACT|nr:hypothetical protein GCM10011339_16070 [Echinicola rosea]
MIFMGSSVWAQQDDPEEIAMSIKAGSSKDLAAFFDRNVELSINGNEGDYSKNQAEMVMRDFFKKFSPSDFDIVHRGTSGNQIEYFIGTYDSSGTIFRILIKCKKDDKGCSIYSLDITKE